MRSLSLCLAVCATALCAMTAPAQAPPPVATAASTFHNPVLPSSADPWVVADGGYYYFMATTGQNLTVRRTRDLANLAKARVKVVWTPPSAGPYAEHIWAPELHKLDGKWYIYFAADNGSNESHRIYVIENASADPMEGEWTFKGKVSDATDKWAIDATVFETRGQKYMLWSGWPGDADGEQRIYIAHLRNPWTVDSPRSELSRPDHPWEEVGDLLGRRDTPHVNVNEAPEILQHDGRIFLVYSGSGCWTDYYELGMLQAREGSNLLRPKSWTKVDQPVFRQDAAAGVYAPGHNAFFQSPDGRQSWIIYHANGSPGLGCGDMRSTRMQPFTWKPDGTPDFGKPVSPTTEMKGPGSY